MVLFMMITAPVFATGITATDGVADPATCDTNVLGTDTGPANLRAEFTPETIDLRWYNNNTLLNVTSTNSNDCTYDTPINLPTNPTKPGYTFKGWKVRPEYDFANLNTNIYGTRTWSRNGPGQHCMSGESGTTETSCDNSDFNDLNYYEWKSVFSYGTIYGFGLCSSTAGETSGQTGTPNETQNSGTYCWCRVTGYIPTGSNVKYSPIKLPVWVFHNSMSGNYCNSGCADWCGSKAITSILYRTSLYN